jgi:hypothetical protein
MALDFLDSLFDTDGDGRLTIFDDILDYQIYKDATKGMNKNNSDSADEDDEYDWREYTEDGSEYGIDPIDFEREYDYLVALEEAQKAAGCSTTDESNNGGSYITVHITADMAERMKTEDPEKVIREEAYKQIVESLGGLLGEDIGNKQETTDDELI